jgi:hypothetical protein
MAGADLTLAERVPSTVCEWRECLFDRRALYLLARQSDGKVCGLSDGASSGLSRTRISFPVLK